PCALLGHSLGEYAVAYAAGVFGLEDAVSLATERAHHMSLAPSGRMAVVLAPELVVKDRLSVHGLVEIDIAAVNAPANTVIAGSPDDITRASEALRAEGLDVELLRIGVASHSSFMREAARALGLAAAKRRFRAPTVLIASSLTGRVAEGEDLCS